jgi:hypothetical protein
MTAPIEPPPEWSRDVPLALPVAAGLCAAVGILSVVGALAVSIPLVTDAHRTWLPLAVNLTAALLMCLAAVFVWKRRKLGVYLIVVAWTLPNMVNLAYSHSLRGPSLLMVLALITLAANWHEFH